MTMKKTAIAVAVLCIVGIAWLMTHRPAVTVTAAIGGTVTWTAPEGSPVAEGDAIVRVSALAGGDAVAARAQRAGIVRECRVHAGDVIRAGVVVARIE